MRSVTVFLTLLILSSCAATAQSPRGAVPQELVAKSAEFNRLYKAKQYREALQIVAELNDAVLRLGMQEAYANGLYNKACVHALLGERPEAMAAVRASIAAGYKNYRQMASDSDFQSLRSMPEFRAVLAELKETYGPRPLVFDPAEKVSPFPLVFDEPNEPNLAQLRKEFEIDAAMDGAKTGYERLQRITVWASKQWQHSSTQMASKPDPLTILREARRGGRFICRDYGIVVAGVAQAYGLPARVLNLLPRDVETRSEAHTVAEVWVPEWKKWVIADGQFGAVPELDGTPLNALELQAALAAEKPVKCIVGSDVCSKWQDFILPNIFYFKIQQDQRRFADKKKPEQLVLVPKGAPWPRKFAGGNEEVFSGAIYISNPSSFYAPPRVYAP